MGIHQKVRKVEFHFFSLPLMPTLVRELYLLALLLSLLGFLLPLVQCEPKEPHHWRQLMERRQPHLKIMNPHDHFAHIMGDVHVLMEAGKQYSCEHNGLDVFGSPLMYKAHLNPRFHIFNSDFDNKIQDVYIEGSRVLIRTSHPDHMLRLKIRKGHIFSTAMDWTQSEEEVHEGTLDLLITEEPIMVAPNVIMLENVVRMEFDQLWNLADIYSNVQHYQYTAPNGTLTERSAPMKFTVIDLVELEDDPLASLHKRGWSLSGTISSVTSFVKKAVAPAINFVTDFAKTIIAVALGNEQHDGFSFWFNYNSYTGKAFLEIPIYSMSREASAESGGGDEPKPGAKPKPEGVSASVSASVSLDVVCSNCWGKATFRSETKFQVSMSAKPVFEYKLSGEFTVKTVIDFIIVGKVTATVDIPIGPVVTAKDPKSTAVSGKPARYEVKAGLYLSGKINVDLSGVLTLDSDVVLTGYVATGIRGLTPFYNSNFAVKSSSFKVSMDAKLTVKWEIALGPKVIGSVYGVGFTITTGVAYEHTFDVTPECKRWIKGTDSAIRPRATIDVALPSSFSSWGIPPLSYQWTFYSYTIHALLGCFLDSDPSAPAPAGEVAIPPASAIPSEGGEIFSFSDMVLPIGQYYTAYSGGYRYDFNIGVPARGTACRGVDTGICRTQTATGAATLVGKFNRDIASSDDGSFRTRYANGASCGSGRREGSIVMECDRTATSPQVDRVVEVDPCRLEIYMKTADACPEACAAFVGTKKWDFTPLRDAGPFHYTNNGTSYTVGLCGEPLAYCEGAGACAEVPIGTLPLV